MRDAEEAAISSVPEGARVAPSGDRTSSGPHVDALPTEPLVGKTFRSKFVIVSRIGSGGMGSVYEARGAHGKLFAVKMLSAHLVRGMASRARFVREARSVAAIDSPHVVQLHEADVDVVSDMPFLVMDRLRGSDLAEVISRLQALDPAVAARIFLQACRGVAAAHNRGIVHRDLKPANIFLHEDDERTIIVKICDFGVAKSATSIAEETTPGSLTATGSMIGSPAYMSPEQARDAKSADERSDIWSLSVALFEALSGTHPFADCTSLGELILAICTRQPKSVGVAAPWLEPALAAVVDRGLRRDPAERHASVDALASELQKFTGGRETIAPEDIAAVPIESRSVHRIALLTSDTTLVSGPRDKAALERLIETLPSAIVDNSAPAPEPADVAPTRAERTAETRRGRIVLASAIAGAIVLTAAVMWPRRRVADAPAFPAAAPSPGAASVSTASSVQVALSAPSADAAREAAKLRIVPRSATVTVNGAPASLVDGVVDLNGEPGESFEIVAQADGVRMVTTVALLKGGRAQPAILYVKRTAEGVPNATVSKPGAAVTASAAATDPTTSGKKKATLDPSDPWTKPAH